MPGFGFGGAMRRHRRGAALLPGAPAPSRFPISAIAADGWQAVWAQGTPPVFTPDSAPQMMAVTRAGFDASGAATSYVDSRIFTRRVRQPFPDQALDTPANVALDDYVYATDTIAGVTNNSAETSPAPVAAWTMPDRLLVGDAISWELVAFHRDARGARQVACVVVTASDGTTSVSQTISATRISTLCADPNPVEVFAGSIDISSLATGLITLNARVYPWIGGASSVRDSSTNSTAREFSPRHYLKNTARAAAPPLAYVASTGSDTTGLWSTNAANAAAAPFLTVGGAFAAIDNATRGTPATGGIADGCRVRIVDNVSAGTNSTNRVQNVAAVVIERAPDTPRASAIVTLGATWAPRLGASGTSLSAPITEGALIFSDVSLSRTGAFTISGAAAARLRLYLLNINLSLTGSGSSMLNQSHDYLYGVTIATTLTGTFGAGTYEHRIFRGVVYDAGNVAMEQWVTIGSSISRPSTASVRDATKGAIIYNNRFLNPNSTASPITIATPSAGQTIADFVAVQNLIETTHTTTSSPAFRLSSDSMRGDSYNTIIAHNVSTGYGTVGRHNIFYDDTPSSEADRRTHRMIRHVGDIASAINSKGDRFYGGVADPAEAPFRLGNFAYTHGVGCEGNWSMFFVTSQAEQTYGGLKSNIGTSTTVRNDPLFVNYRGTDGAQDIASAGTGGGDYRLRANSPARGAVRGPVLSFDLAGAPRTAGAQPAGAYV
jgi:hypothetical protein